VGRFDRFLRPLFGFGDFRLHLCISAAPEFPHLTGEPGMKLPEKGRRVSPFGKNVLLQSRPDPTLVIPKKLTFGNEGIRVDSYAAAPNALTAPVLTHRCAQCLSRTHSRCVPDILTCIPEPIHPRVPHILTEGPEKLHLASPKALSHKGLRWR
jgi:hypothetical protein